MKDATVSARVEYDVKRRAEEILRQIGVPVSVLINSLYRQIIFQRGVPFQLTLPRDRGAGHACFHVKTGETSQPRTLVLARRSQATRQLMGWPIVPRFCPYPNGRRGHIGTRQPLFTRECNGGTRKVAAFARLVQFLRHAWNGASKARP